MTPDQIEVWLAENSHKMDGPAQMIGEEPNAPRKPWNDYPVRWLIAAAWPYFHGAGNQSIPAVCQTVNDHPECLADRWYLPETPRDFRMLERSGIGVFGVESKHPMADFDVVGTSISYTVLLMNFARYLTASGIPLRWRDREKDAGRWPMVIIGGQSYCAPGQYEPIADCVFLGEAEDEPGNGGLGTVCDRIAAFKELGLWQSDRIECYRMLAREFSYLYFPRFTEVIYGYEEREGLEHPSKQVTGYRSLLDGMRMPFRARHVIDMDAIESLRSAPLLFVNPAMGAGDIETGRGCPAWCSFPLLGSEQIVTRDGVRAIGALAGQDVEVWTGAGWQKGSAESHGSHGVQRITFAPATPSGWARTETCEYGHPREGEIEGLRKTGRSVRQPATVGPRRRCRACHRLWARNAYYARTGRPEKVVQLDPIAGWQRYSATGWRQSSRTTVRQQVIATPCHGWELVSGEETHALKIGDFVKAAAVELVDESSREFKRGWIHGMVFGDGSKAGGRHTRGYRIRLHGEKDQAHLWRFREAMDWDYVHDGMQVRSITYPHHPVSPDGEPAVWIRALTPLKEYPHDRISSPGYLAGFLAGWLAADSSGRQDESEVRRLYSQRDDSREWLDRYAAAAGWLLVGHAVHDTPTNFGPRSSPMNAFTLAPAGESVRGWKVVSVETLPGESEVYCLTVPEARRFTLASGIMTGNCRLSWVSKPYRQRTVDMTVRQAETWVRAMGSNELSPFSPDFPMHTRKKALLAALLENVTDELDTATMRIDDFIADNEYILVQTFGGMDSVTLGLEGNSQRMRDLVGKGTSDQDVLDAFTSGIRAGVRKFKFYMITNLPGEEPGDVMRIIKLGHKLAQLRTKLGQDNVLIQFSWTPLLIEAQTPMQWFASTPPDHTLIDAIDAFRDLKIAIKIGTKAEPNKVALFQLAQRASRDVGEAMCDVFEKLNTACWGGVPRTMKEDLEAALRARGFRNGLADCVGERFENDLFGWEFISTGVEKSLMWTTYRQMLEFAEGTDAETYDEQLPPDYHGAEFVARCDQTCLGRSCGACKPADLRKRTGYIRAAATERKIDLAELRPVDLTTQAQRVRVRLEIAQRYRQADPIFWRHAVRRAAYRAFHELRPVLPEGCNISKRSIRLATDQISVRDWSYGADWLDFALTRPILNGEQGLLLLEAMGRELEPWAELGGVWAPYPASAPLNGSLTAFYEVQAHTEDPDELAARFAAWDRSETVPLTLTADSSYFGLGTEEVDAKVLVRDMWAIRDDRSMMVRFLADGKAGPYQLYAALAGSSGWISHAGRHARRLEWLDYAASPEACTDCGEPLPLTVLGDLWGEEYCPRCSDFLHGSYAGGLVPRVLAR